MEIEDGKTYHLGHFFRDNMLKNPDAVCQIDAATAEEETRGSVLARATALARCLRALGLKPGDVLALGGDNHLDIHIPYYAALMNGYPIGGVDPFFDFDEIKHLFRQMEPKIAFCQQSSSEDYRRAAEELGLDMKVVTFDGSDNTMTKLIQQYDTKDVDGFQITGARKSTLHENYRLTKHLTKIEKTTSIENIMNILIVKVADFDTDKVYAWLVSTSGSSGRPKLAAVKHKDVMNMIKISSQNISKTLKHALHLSTVQWLTAYFSAVAMPFRNHIKVQTSAPLSVEHTVDIINKYRPVQMVVTPWLVYRILYYQKTCDISCFDTIVLAGAHIHRNFLVDLRSALRPDAEVWSSYGNTECLGGVLRPAPDGPIGNVGVEDPATRVKLVDPISEETITEPNIPGELWTKGGPQFTEYYKNPEETAKAITPDGWYKTGDLLKRDENGFFFFVERKTSLIKYRSYQVIAPLELEELIKTLEGVDEVCVSSVADPIDGEWPVAVVVRKPGAAVSAQDIKELVANKLSEHKQLRGGVVFVNDIPMTSSGKMARAKVKQLVRNGHLQHLTMNNSTLL